MQLSSNLCEMMNYKYPCLVMKSPISQIRLSIGSFFKAFSFLRKHKLRHYYLYPIILGVLVFGGGMWFILDYVDALREWLMDVLNIEISGISKDNGFWENVKQGGLKFTEVLLFFSLKIGVLYILLKANKYIVLIFLAPVLAYLSEKTEEILTGNEYPFNMRQFLYDIWRGVLIAIRNMFIEISLTIAIFVVTFFVPIISPLTAIFLFMVGSYFYGFSMFDYWNERRKMKMGESVKKMREMKWYLIGNGAIFSAFMLIPVIGTVLAPMNAVVGSVIAYDEIEKN
jgi:CysZ protein